MSAEGGGGDYLRSMISQERVVVGLAMLSGLKKWHTPRGIEFWHVESLDIAHQIINPNTAWVLPTKFRSMH